MPVRIDALLTGKAKFFARGEASAIDKAVVEGPRRIGFLGLEGDEQADLRYHGGPDKALHHYPFDHNAQWAMRLPGQRLLDAPGAFGENISTSGLSETDVCIGDRLRCGTALLEISQGRQPCWKQGVRLEWTALPAQMVKERRSGWYYRVIEEGVAQAGDMLALVDRPLPEWSVARVFGLLIAGDHKHDTAAVRSLAKIEVLNEEWRSRAAALSQ
jgi:MOSC domain-containing protein YiiM